MKKQIILLFVVSSLMAGVLSANPGRKEAAKKSVAFDQDLIMTSTKFSIAKKRGLLSVDCKKQQVKSQKKKDEKHEVRSIAKDKPVKFSQEKKTEEPKVHKVEKAEQKREEERKLKREKKHKKIEAYKPRERSKEKKRR